MLIADLRKLNEARAARRAVACLTETDSGNCRVLVEGDTVDAALAELVDEAFRHGRSGLIETPLGSMFVNVYLPPPRIVVIGAVHISQALAQIARVAGYDLTVIDPRTAFATPERFLGTDLVADWPEDVLTTRPLDRYSALVAVTHDPKIDDMPLIAALSTGCFYVGALGSRKTHARRLERLSAAGMTEAQVASICAPIGLDIGASSPAEIAVAIMAEIIRAFRRREIGAGARG